MSTTNPLLKAEQIMRKQTSLNWMTGLVLSLFFAVSGYATGDSLHYILQTDSIFLKVDYHQNKYIIHSLEKGQTLYSLARFYGLSVEELYYYNQGLQDKHASIGTDIKVPIPNRSLRRFLDSDVDVRDYVPVYYIVGKGDTFYGIAVRQFRITVDELMERNNMQDTYLHLGQTLLVGWMNIHGLSSEERAFKGGPLARRNFAMKRLYLREFRPDKEKEQSGVAAWNKSTSERADFYALHRYAKINSVIKVHNPMNNRDVYVRVLGRIPDTSYDYNVVVVVSPVVAKLLGAQDAKFHVDVNYH